MRHPRTLFLIITIFFSFNCLAGPAFDVASVRLSPENIRPNPSLQTAPGLLTTRDLTLAACIMRAYQLQPFQLAGPAWLGSVRLDIVAKAAAVVDDQQLYLILQTLLGERMGLKTHVERREMPVYTLVIAKGGPKFSESATPGPRTTTQDKGAMNIQHVSMSELALVLSSGLGRPVIDSTGLSGHYDIRLDVASVAVTTQADRIDAASAMITALQEQMGLKVEDRKDLVDVLVIDHAEKTPTEN